MAALAVGCAPPAASVVAAPEPAPPRAAAPDAPGLPLSGGTLLVARDGRTAAVADPETDRVFVVDLRRMRIAAVAQLEPGDEPGRIVEDLGGRLHVALRRGGALLTLEKDGTQVLRRATCPAPRGLALDPAGDALHVACAGGALQTFGVFDPSPRRSLRPAPDLRDVVLAGGLLHVSRFRAAEVLSLDAAGNVVATRRPPDLDADALASRVADDRPRRVFAPAVAWRMVEDAVAGQLVMIHQRAARFPVDLEVPPDLPVGRGYGAAPPPRPLAGCPPGIAHSAVSRFEARPGWSRDVEPSALPILARSLPIDVAASPDGARVAMVFPGHVFGELQVVDRSLLDGRGCVHGAMEPGQGVDALAYREPVAVAWVSPRRLAVQYRRPSALVVYSGNGLAEARAVPLGGALPEQAGHEIFHAETSSRLACATCHPEGGDDGRVWELGRFGGTRRTQPLHGDVTDSAPFHWAGDLATLRELVDEVHGRRMGGPELSRAEVGALEAFLAAIPEAPRAGVDDPGAVSRGRRAFVDAGCARCHAGERLTDGRSWDVGTGEALQTPTLRGLAARPPYLHDGRAPTLRARLDVGHTAGHGALSPLNPRARADLIAYLRAQ